MDFRVVHKQNIPNVRLFSLEGSLGSHLVPGPQDIMSFQIPGCYSFTCMLTATLHDPFLGKASI